VSRAPEGLLLVDKPAGPTSHDIVVGVRRALRQPRAGHTGTLDPMATGLLVMALGRATRLIRFLPSAPKAYAGTFVLGRATNTDDTTGETVRRHAGPLPRPAEVVAAAVALLGASLQRPPDYSARKVGGERLYDLARRGETPAAPHAPIVVGAFDVRPADAEGTWAFETSVSAGTYVRGLVRDLGEALGCGATLASLRRTSIGPLRVEDAVAIPAQGRLDPEALAPRVVPIDAVPLPFPGVVLADPTAIARFLGGNPAADPGIDPAPGLCRVADAAGRLLGVGEHDGAAIRPCVVLGEPSRLPDRRAV
jgi:tRNA pseudouridine55 synthase